MKKCIAILLILTTVLSISVLSYADQKTMTVTMTLGDIYTYTIPSSVSLNRTGNKTGDIVFSIDNLDPGHFLQISVSGDVSIDYDNIFYLTACDNMNPVKSVPFQVFFNNTAVSNGVPFASITEIGDSTIPIVIQPKNVPQEATGEYSGNITISVIPVVSDSY